MAGTPDAKGPALAAQLAAVQEKKRKRKFPYRKVVAAGPYHQTVYSATSMAMMASEAQLNPTLVVVSTAL